MGRDSRGTRTQKSPAGGDTRWLLDLAAGRPLDGTRSISETDLELAVRHGLIGVMVDSANEQVNHAAVPIFARLKARQEVMERHLARVLESLHESDIRATVLKGPHLAQWAYRNPDNRTYTDIDLLVPAGQVDAALSVLASDAAVSSIPPKTPKADKRNIPMSDPSGISFNLDLHWDLFSYNQLRGCAAGATEWAWDHARFSPDHPLGPLWELPDEAMIVFLGTHAVLDHRFRMILFRDLAEVARKGTDWGAVLAFAERWRLRSTTYVSLFIARRQTNAPIDDALVLSLRPNSAPIRAVERLLASTDLLRFDGHRVHPLNLAMVLLHDDRKTRLRLLTEAPAAFPAWRKRVATPTRPPLSTGDRRTKMLRLGNKHERAVPAEDPLILHVLPVDIARGAQTFAEALSRMLDGNLGRHRTMTIFQSDPIALHADIELGARLGWARQRGFDVRAVWKLRRAMKRLQPAVVVAHGGESLKYTALTALRRSKLVYYKIGTSRAQLARTSRRLAYRFFASRCDVVAGVSREMVDEAHDVLGVAPDNAKYAPNGRDPAQFIEWLGPPADSPVRFVFVGHVTRTKRPERFVEVIRQLVTAGIGVEGVVVGDGPMLREITRLAANLPIDVLGRRNDVPEILSTADVFLFPSLEEGEGMPGVLIEAGFAGLPVVTTEVPGAHTVIEDGVTGFVVGVDDLDEYVNAARRLAIDPALRRHMGEAAYERCMSEFTLEVSVGVWRDLLGGLLADSRASIAP